MGAQNIAPESTNKEMTGEISASMLDDMNVKFVIVGHSERRAMGETDEIVSKKTRNALKNKITPIVCVGEKERDVEAHFLRILEKQIRDSLANLSKEQIKKIIIAYEPVWAVGEKGHVIDVHDLNQTILFIRKVLVNIADRTVGLNLPILYGGSVDAENLAHIFSADIQGVLIGRASVNPFEFGKILKQ
jgi:triosephosphate isomerase